MKLNIIFRSARTSFEPSIPVYPSVHLQQCFLFHYIFLLHKKIPFQNIFFPFLLLRKKIFSFSKYCPHFPSPFFFASTKWYFPSPNSFLLFFLPFSCPPQKIFSLSKYLPQFSLSVFIFYAEKKMYPFVKYLPPFPPPFFLRDIECNLSISPVILSHINYKLADLYSLIWSSRFFCDNYFGYLYFR